MFYTTDSSCWLIGRKRKGTVSVLPTRCLLRCTFPVSVSWAPSLLWSLSTCVCVHEDRWKSMQSHFKGRGKGGEGRRGFWQDGASWGICSLALGMAQMGTLSARAWTACSGGKKKACKLGFLPLSILTFIYLFFSFFPLIPPCHQWQN